MKPYSPAIDCVWMLLAAGMIGIASAASSAYGDDSMDPQAMHQHMVMHGGASSDAADPQAMHQPMAMHEPMPGMSGDTANPHAQHHHMMMTMPTDVKRSIVAYKIPKLSLVREDGQSVLLPDELNDGRIVVMNFVFTKCTAICPVSSRIFAQLQSKLGDKEAKVHLVSISIDPEYDTPEVLTAYGHKFGAKADWQFYTGTLKASIAAQEAFGVYRGDKMEHTPVTLVRKAPGKPWVRFDGFVTADQLLGELGDTLASQ